MCLGTTPDVVERTTGIKVPDLGPRDEHGFEPMDDLFSSPEKAPVTTNGDNEYTVTEDTMELVDSKPGERAWTEQVC